MSGGLQTIGISRLKGSWRRVIMPRRVPKTMIVCFRSPKTQAGPTRHGSKSLRPMIRPSAAIVQELRPTTTPRAIAGTMGCGSAATIMGNRGWTFRGGPPKPLKALGSMTKVCWMSFQSTPIGRGTTRTVWTLRSRRFLIPTVPLRKGTDFWPMRALRPVNFLPNPIWASMGPRVWFASKPW